MPAITEENIVQFYEQNKDRAQGRTLDQLRGEIKPYLEARRGQQARAMLVDELKTKSGASVKVMLDPPRYTVPTSAEIRCAAIRRRRSSSSSFPTTVSILRARQSDAGEDPRDLRRSRQDRVQRLPAAEPPAGAEGRRSGALRGRSEEILGDARRHASRTSARSKRRCSSRPPARLASTARLRSVPGFRKWAEAVTAGASSAERWA